MARTLIPAATIATLVAFLSVEVSGFSTTPTGGGGGDGDSDDDLAPKGANPEDYKIQKIDPNTGLCMYYMYEGFCYTTQAMPGYCANLQSQCAAGSTSASCQNYDWQIQIEECPETRGAGTTTWCLSISAKENGREQNPQVWCSSYNSQSSCENAYVTWMSGSIKRYAQCEWDKNSCSTQKRTIGGTVYTVAQECKPFCPVDRSNMNDIGGNGGDYCNTGSIQDSGPNSLTARRASEEVCERNYVSNPRGNNDLAPCVWQAGPDFPACSATESCACENTPIVQGCNPERELCTVSGSNAASFCSDL